MKRSNALKAANLQRNENDENNNCDRWRNSLPLSRPEKLLRLVPLADQSLRWTSSVVLQMFKSSGVEIFIGSFHLRPRLVSPLGRVEPADQLLGRALCLHRRFRGCSHITSAKIRGSWTPPPPYVSNGQHLAYLVDRPTQLVCIWIFIC